MNPLKHKVQNAKPVGDSQSVSASDREVQRRQSTTGMKNALQVMKFGGTSVGDASCIRRVVEIVRAAAARNDVVVVVSAMSGVTNRLIEAANQSKAGNENAVAGIFKQLREQHGEVVQSLIHSTVSRQDLETGLNNLFQEAERLCQGTLLLRELTPRTLDAISGFGERLCAPLVAAALVEIGVVSEAMDATKLVVTDSTHGGAEPLIDDTRANCQARLVPLLQSGIVPVVTGFIGATEEAVLTTLGRGGSDYSATILGAALDADEVVIWSDVSGLLTADPRLVGDARTVAEISYREAAELAYFGAKVLHPKTLRPVMQRSIPVWIKNTFAPSELGTKITPNGPLHAAGVKALTSIRDAALITVAGLGAQGVPDVLARTIATAAAVKAEVLLISQSSSHNDICLVIPAAAAKRTVEELRFVFVANLSESAEQTIFDSPVSVITLVGQSMRTASGTVSRTCAALEQESLEIIAAIHGSSDCSMSFVVHQQDLKIALESIHRELELDNPPMNSRPVAAVDSASAIWKYQSQPASAD